MTTDRTRPPQAGPAQRLTVEERIEIRHDALSFALEIKPTEYVDQLLDLAITVESFLIESLLHPTPPAPNRRPATGGLFAIKLPEPGAAQ